MESHGFSADLNRYLAKVLKDNGKEDLSGRWLESVTEKARRYDYWSRLVKDERAMTTNDVQVLANSFGVSPFEWVANARRHASGQDTFPLTVRGLTDDDYEQQPTSEQRIPVRKAAKRGQLKGDQAFGGSDEGIDQDGGESGA